MVPTQFSRAKSAPLIKRQLRGTLSASTLNPSNLAVPDPRLALHPGHLSGELLIAYSYIPYLSDHCFLSGRFGIFELFEIMSVCCVFAITTDVSTA